ncbi:MULTISPECIES: MBL fold metallo-hydrolase [unclassified Streptomyces]|uniref:MBL fold metallo-hydrolase n=1 Tax=unclassified Streptomyces TaxID=2593676 RepID=UPI00332ABC5C
MDDEQDVRTFTVGDVEVLRIVERQGPLVPAKRLVPEAGEEVWREHAGDLVPRYWDPDRDMAMLAVQTWVVRSGGRTVLVDTGVGRDRERPGNPLFHRQPGDLPGRLRRAGVDPAEVDVVVNTHIHGDHVGWNTHDENGEWAPTFPRARYLLPAADDRYFGPEGGYGGGARVDDRLLYEDSVAPVHRAGQAVVWEDGYRVDGHLSLEPAPGHTPGSSVLRVSSRGEHALFVGDVLHSPVQILRPECNSCFCLDPSQAAASRRRLLQLASEERALVIPAHFAGTGVVEVGSENGRFGLRRWDA